MLASNEGKTTQKIGKIGKTPKKSTFITSAVETKSEVLKSTFSKNPVLGPGFH